MKLKVLPLTYGIQPSCKLVDVDIDGNQVQRAWFFDRNFARYVAGLIKADRRKWKTPKRRKR